MSSDSLIGRLCWSAICPIASYSVDLQYLCLTLFQWQLAVLGRKQQTGPVWCPCSRTAAGRVLGAWQSVFFRLWSAATQLDVLTCRAQPCSHSLQTASADRRSVARTSWWLITLARRPLMASIIVWWILSGIFQWVWCSTSSTMLHHVHISGNMDPCTTTGKSLSNNAISGGERTFPAHQVGW